MCEWPGRSYLQCLVARRAAALLLRREPALSAPAATTAAPTYLARSGWAGTCCSPGHHSARSPPPCTPLPATGRGKVAEHVRKSCALSRRRLATPSRESSASPARPGEAGPSEAPARRRRAPYDLQGRPEGLASRSPTQLPGHESAVAAPAATCASPHFSFVAGPRFHPYMSVPTGPTWGGAGPVSRVSRDSLILTLYHGRDRSARGRTRSVWPACRATMRVIGWNRATMGAPQHAGWGGTLMYGCK